jgi:hypothetical protein
MLALLLGAAVVVVVLVGATTATHQMDAPIEAPTNDGASVVVTRVERRLLSESRVAAFGLGSVHGSALDLGLTQHGVIQTIPKLTVARARYVPDRAATGGKSQRTTGRWSRTLRKHEGLGFRGLNVFVAGVGFEPT